MKKFMKKLAKKSEGFTLVELIVVIAILGILAGIAVPAYSGYLTKAKDAGVVVELDAIKTAAMGANASAGEISGIVVDADGKGVTITAANYAEDFATDFEIYYEGASNTSGTDPITADITEIVNFTSSSYKTGAHWTAADGWDVGLS